MIRIADYFRYPTATIDDGAKIGKDTRIGHYSHIMAGAQIGINCVLGQNVFVADGVIIGNNVEVQNNVSVYKGVTLEDDVFCGPSVVFTNDRNPRSGIEKEANPTLVRHGVNLGANCTIVCGITIGQYAAVGAGAVVTKDVSDFTLVTGAPATYQGWAWAAYPCIQNSHFRANLDWLRENGDTFRGQWIALDNGKLLGVADSLKMLTMIGQVSSAENALITKVF